MSFETHTQNDLIWLTSGQLSGVRHAFSTRKGGVSKSPMDTLNLGVGRGDDREALLENYRRFCSILGESPSRTVLSKQVHRTDIRVCTASDAGKGLLTPQDYEADALITNESHLPIAVFSADCGIILLYDPVHHAVGAVHAGWRGCAAGILEKTVQAMHTQFSTQPSDLIAAIGPCIGPCCFETDHDVAEAMVSALGESAAPYLKKTGAKWHVDLGGLNQLWLIRSGIPEKHIDLCGLCTACHPELFWSHRKMGEARGLQTAMIALD